MPLARINAAAAAVPNVLLLLYYMLRAAIRAKPGHGIIHFPVILFAFKRRNSLLSISILISTLFAFLPTDIVSAALRKKS